jgi:hypothetical protein
MSGLTWLHLSDWHQRGPDFDRRIVRDALLTDLRDRAKLDPGSAPVSNVSRKSETGATPRPKQTTPWSLVLRHPSRAWGRR